MDENNELIIQRINKVKELREKGLDPYYNKFKVKHKSDEATEYGTGKTKEELSSDEKSFTLAGRVMAIRTMAETSCPENRVFIVSSLVLRASNHALD